MTMRWPSRSSGSTSSNAVRRDGPFRTVDDLELATLNWVHWFNGHRLHSSIGLVPPVEFENAYYRQINSQQRPLLGELASH